MSDRHPHAALHLTLEYPRHVHASAASSDDADRLIADGGVADDETARAFPKTYHKHLASADDAPAALAAGWTVDVEPPAEAEPPADADPLPPVPKKAKK